MIIQQRATEDSSYGDGAGKAEGLVVGNIGLAKAELLPGALPGPADER